MARNTAKKVLLTGIFALSSAFILAACDNVEAIPQNYQNPIVYKDGNAFDDDENKYGDLYEQLIDNKNEAVVSTLLEKIAEKEFGTYAELKECFDSEGNVIAEKANAHIAKYSHEFTEADDGDYAEKGMNAEQIRLARFKLFFEDLNDRIDKVVYDEINGDTENYRDSLDKTKFVEEKFARAKREANFDIKHFTEDGKVEEGYSFAEKFITSTFTEKNVRSYFNEFDDTYEDYITKKIIPDVYRDKLIEEYIIDNNYSALGRAYGRKINYVKVSSLGDDSNTAYRLVHLFAEQKLNTIDAETAVSFDDLVSWFKGFKGVSLVGGNPTIEPLSPTAELTKIYGEPRLLKAKCDKDPSFDGSTLFNTLTKYGIDPTTFKFYENTKLGEILKNYEKAVVGGATRFASAEDNTQYENFTDSGKQSKERGLIKKITDLALEKYSDEGWFVKNDTANPLGNLPDTVKTRLFNIKVANDFDRDDWTYDREKSYFNELKGHKYLTPAAAKDVDYNFIIEDEDGSNLYIVEILEAASTSKLTKSVDNTKSYVNSGNPFKCEEVARHIAKILGTKDTYKTNAYTSYLKLYTFTYHDTSVYDYIKETYPDLFE